VCGTTPKRTVKRVSNPNLNELFDLTFTRDNAPTPLLHLLPQQDRFLKFILKANIALLIR
jgi:hypothetical protein